MKSALRYGSLPMIVLMVSGCGLPGHWRSTSLSPEMARDEFRVFGPVAPGAEFTQAVLHLHDNGTYSGQAYYGERLQQSTGSWTHKDGKLTLVDDKGKAYTFNVDLSSDKKELRLSKQIEGTDVVLVLERES